MRIIKSQRGYFLGTHKGAQIEIERDTEIPSHSFYIRVWHLKNGGYLYDGLAPEEITTMKQAKRDAIRGAGLNKKEPTP